MNAAAVRIRRGGIEEPPDDRPAVTHKFHVGGQEGFLTVNLYADGRPCAIMITLVDAPPEEREVLECFCDAVSIGLQSKISLRAYCRAYEERNASLDDDVETSKPDPSLIGYVFQWLRERFLTTPPRPIRPGEGMR